MTCPHCAATTTAELSQRTLLGYRTFRCSACRRQFNERTATPFNYLEFPTDIGDHNISGAKLRRRSHPLYLTLNSAAEMPYATGCRRSCC